MKRLGVSLVGLVLPIVIALALGCVLVFLIGESPGEMMKYLWWGAFGTMGNTLITLRWATPLILSGLAVTVAYRAGLFNMGGDGQIYIGALCAAIVGVELALPAYIHLPVALMAAALGGALFALIPAILKVHLKVNEIVTTLMFNYIGLLLTDYLVLLFYFQGDSNKAVEIAMPRIRDTAAIARIVPRYPLTWGIMVSIALAIVVQIILKRTVWGYEKETLGANPRFAQYIGINIKRSALMAFMISGAIAGIAGGLEILGTNRRFVSHFSTGLGNEGIVVALLGRTDPLGMVVAGLFLAALKNGFFAVERMTNIDRSVAIVLQGMILLFISSRALVRVFYGLGKGEDSDGRNS